jgi:hypothetical protein
VVGGVGEARLPAPHVHRPLLKPPPQHDRRRITTMACTLLSGVHGLLAQVVLCALALGSLMAKRLVEKPRRPLPVRRLTS